MRRLITTSCRAKNLSHWIRLDAEFRSDLAWWSSFLDKWNGRSMMEVHAPSWNPTVEFSSDASGAWGCGAVWNNHWIQPPWQEAWKSVGITAKELLPIVIACALWGQYWAQYWAHCQVQAWCDNAAVVHILDSLTSKDPTIMHLLRCLHFFCAHFDIALRARHIRGRENTQADALSRNLLQVFFRQVPAAKQQTRIPQPLWDMLVVSRPDWLSPSWKELLTSSLREA